MSDKQADKLASLFDAQQAAPINPDAKQQAINAAMQAFAAAQPHQAAEADAASATGQTNVNHGPLPWWQKIKQRFFQGFASSSRPTDNNNGRRNSMTQQLIWRYGAGATFACVLMLAILIGVKPTDFDDNNIALQPVEIAERGTALSPEKVEADALTEQRGKQQAGENTPPLNPVEIKEQALAENFGASAPATTALQLKKEARFVTESAKRSANAMGVPTISRKPIASLDSVGNSAGITNTDITGTQAPEEGRDDFTRVEENSVKRVVDEPVSTFSIDVDTASYAFVRRQLNHGVLPQKDAVRIEEMINYFDYQYPLPESKRQPFSTQVVVSESPWKPGNQLVHIGIKGYELERKQLPKSNLVFLLDVSGSMNSRDKLPLVKQSMALLLDQLNPQDTVAIAVYAGAAGTVLAPTPAKEKQKILDAMNGLNAGGSTAGAQGIQLAYQLAQTHFDKQAVNRVILATDGDFNVGITNPDELKSYVERKRESGVFLSVLGFGQGNYHDHLMQQLAQNGNGIAAYIDTLSEAQKVLVEEATSSLFPIAKDVKVQVEFNPATVSEYRLIGYETRKLNREDFNNDKVDAGDIGAGHTVTAIYEITPSQSDSKLIDESRYAGNRSQDDNKAQNAQQHEEFGFVKLRYKLPQESTSKLINQAIPAKTSMSEQSPLMQQEIQFATAVAGFAQLLKGGKYLADWTYDDAITLALANRGEDVFGYRNEFVQLIRKAKIAK
ncbi:hypothetical protein TDB9533_03295 [Thalassocella blandensis]|nr:hypothetical protein TDB9533_03295 [Thalassocella blandensis]